METTNQFFPMLPESEFFDRDREVEYIVRMGLNTAHARTRSAILFGSRGIGKSEVLKRSYHRLFWEQDDIVPIYYNVSAECLFVSDFVRNYLAEFLRQYLAFKHKEDYGAFHHTLSLRRLVDLAKDFGENWLATLIPQCEESLAERDYLNALKSAILAPYYVAHHNDCRLYVIIDEFQRVKDLRTDIGPFHVLGLYQQVVQSRRCPHLFSGSSRKLIEGIVGGSTSLADLERLELQEFGHHDALQMFEQLCERFQVPYRKEFLVDFVEQIGGNPLYIRNIVHQAQKQQVALTSIRSCQTIYAEEVIAGHTHFYWTALLKNQIRDPLRRKHALGLFHTVTVAPQMKFSLDYLAHRLSRSTEEVREILGDLEQLGIVDFDFGQVAVAEDAIMRDCFLVLYETEVKGMQRDRVASDVIKRKLKDMARFQRRRERSGIEKKLEQILNSFDCQQIPQILFSYQDFSEQYGTSGSDITLGEIRKHPRTMTLPQVVGTSKEIVPLDVTPSTETYHNPFVFTSYAFKSGLYSSGNEVVWLVELLESASPVTSVEVEDFQAKCLRLQKRFGRVGLVKWIVGKDTFSEESLELIQNYNMYASNLVQLGLIGECLSTAEKVPFRQYAAEAAPETEAPATEAREVTEFKLTLPIVPDAELVAANAIEQIAKNADFDEQAIGQMKMAIIEACINAIEYSPNKEKKIRLHFITKPDRVEVWVENEGPPLELGPVGEPAIAQKVIDPNKRGWGIKLIQSLMDDVEFDMLEHGTRLRMVKLKHPPEQQTTSSEATEGETP